MPQQQERLSIPVDRISPKQLKELAASRDDACVSIHMPTQVRGSETQQNAVLFRNALDQCLDQLSALGIAEGQARRQLAPAYERLEDDDYWQHQGHGLVVLIDASEMHSFRLPFSPLPLTCVSHRFQIKPLFQFLGTTTRFYMLTLSQNRSALYRATSYEIEPVAMEDAPQSMEDVMRYVDEQKTLQFHTSGVSGSGGQRRTVAFHGHGVGVDESMHEKRIAEYCQMVDHSINQHLKQEQLPLVVAADQRLHAIYQSVSKYPRLIPQAVTGNPDHQPLEELHAHACSLVEPQLDDAFQKDVDRFHVAQSRQHGLDEIESTLRAASDSQVDTVFVATDHQAWGNFNTEAREVTLRDPSNQEADDLLDLAAAETYLRAGQIHAVVAEQVPGDNDIAAILRFPAPADKR